MTKISKYDVVAENNLEKMTQKVNALINEKGWQPYGSFQVSIPVIEDIPGPLYCQAMVKYADV